MASLTNDFDSYKCVHYADGPNGQTDVIICYKGKRIAGHMFFFWNDVRLPKNFIESNRYIRLHYRRSQFADIMNTLRYEKPLVISLNEVTGFSGVGTKLLERVGEEESE